MSGHIIEIITSKINNHFTQKYPLDFHKIGLNYDNLKVLVERLFSREGKDISSLSKTDIRIKMENLIQILETKIKTKLELEQKELQEEDKKLQYEQPNNYYNSNKGYETDTTFKYEETFKESMKNLEDTPSERSYPSTSEGVNYHSNLHTDTLLKDRFYPEEMKYETRHTRKINIKINSKDRKIALSPSPGNIVFNFSKDAPLKIPEYINNNLSITVGKEDHDSINKKDLNSVEEDEKSNKKEDTPTNSFLSKIKKHKNNQELEVNPKKLLGNSVIPVNLNEVVSIRVSSIILFDKCMLSKRPNPYLLLQIPELTKEIETLDNSQVLGGDNNILNSIMCLDDYRVMNGYRYYQNSDCQSIKFETPRNIDKLTFQLINPSGEEVKMTSQMDNTPETVVQYSLELEMLS
tara:strand:- start:409 stop:1629 length:1221 start_codon:yes stop_codon:yes gene_type:complete